MNFHIRDEWTERNGTQESVAIINILISHKHRLFGGGVVDKRTNE